MARPSPLSRPGPQLSNRLGAPLTGGDVPYDPDGTDLDAETIQDAIDELYLLISTSVYGTMPLTAVVDGEPVLVWDENDSLIPVEA